MFVTTSQQGRKKSFLFCNILLTKRKNMVKSVVRSQRRENDISNLSEPYFFVFAISIFRDCGIFFCAFVSKKYLGGHFYEIDL